MREISKLDPVRETLSHFCHPLNHSGPVGGVRQKPQRRSAARKRTPLWAGCVAAFALACGSTVSSAADMALKAPQQPVYQWSGCYAGLNLGGGASGTNFNSTVDPGTHLLGADPAIVTGSGGDGHSSDGLLAGGQVGCNIQSGSLVFGLEGDFDYFHSNPFSVNNSNTLSDGATPFTVSHSLTTDYLATIRPRIGIAADRNLAYLTAGVAFTRSTIWKATATAPCLPAAEPHWHRSL